MTRFSIFSRIPCPRMARYFPIFHWLRFYSRRDLNGDLFAGVITAILLIPQGIAYAMVAGLPVQMGLYASILPPFFYALTGTSRVLSVGPVSIAAIMVLAALSTPEVSALGNPMESAIILAAEGGIILLLMALFRLGGIVKLISHPVLTGFTSGAAILIILSQLSHVIGVQFKSCEPELSCLATTLTNFNAMALLLAGTTLLIMLCFGKPLAYVLERLFFSEAIAVSLSKCAPILAVFGTSIAVYGFDLNGLFNVAVVGDVPAGLPRLSLDFIGSPKWQMLLPFSAMIALIAYIESVAISKVVANITRQKIDPNQELIALGGANLMTALSGGMSVAGGFSRTMVNFSAGARTQLAMLVAVSIVTIAMLFFTAGFYFIPKATLAAIIIMAVLPLVRLNSIIKTWRYDNCEGASEVVTLLGVLLLGIEEGLAIGVIMTFVSHIRKVSHPHIAVVGRVPGTEHFRNERRHTVQTWDTLLLLRIDESMTYHNIIFIEEFVNGELAQRPDTRSVVLIFASVSNIDSTALEVLVNLNKELSLANIKLCLSEVKGPVMDRLERTEFLAQLTPERVFLTTEQAVKTLLD